jgi:hypothetical protein
MMQDIETHVPHPLDAVLRDLHLTWCDDRCPPDWHLAEADPVVAAITLATALWEMADDAARGVADSAAALVTLTAYVEKA